MITDFHAHIYPEKVAAKAVESIGNFYHVPISGGGTVDDLLERGRKGGVGRFVVFSAAESAAKVARINDYIAGVCRDHSGTEGGIELVGFGTMHKDLDADAAAAEIDRMTGLGLRGVKLHPDMQKFAIDDEKMTDIYALLEGRLPVVFHTGDYRYSWSHPERLARVLDAFPRLRVVAAHFGGWSMYDLALEYFRGRNCYLDLSSSFHQLGKTRVQELIRIYGAERILFASDYPMWDPAVCLEEFYSLGLSAEENELILNTNAERLLG